MSKTVHITSAAQYSQLLSSSKIVVTDFYADWCGPCKQIAPAYEQLSAQLSRPGAITFTKVDVDTQQEIASSYGVTAMPTFIIFKSGSVISTIRGADARKLNEAVRRLAAEAESLNTNSSGSGGSSSAANNEGSEFWLGAPLPKGYVDITDQLDMKNTHVLNVDSAYGPVTALFNRSAPSTLDKAKKGKGKSAETGEEKKAAVDWIESDTDEQLMIYMPFQSSLKIHSLHLTSLPPPSSPSSSSPSSTSTEQATRPKTLKIFSNKPQILGFDEAEDLPATQTMTLQESDWNKQTGTATLELRFVKFQNVSSLVVFVVDALDEAEKVRLDRLRVVGEKGESREFGKLEKIGDEAGE